MNVFEAEEKGGEGETFFRKFLLPPSNFLQIRVFGAVDDVVLQVGGHVAEVRAVPGHTDDQVAIAVRVLLGESR